ncbi:glycosyltransferase family 39 protein [bacterium]|nr:glycosyltransferase family 39 protein [candidate division CSSED10-310 bacterium]
MLFITILCWAAYLRFKDLTVNPPGMFPDEASSGYDAWCLLNYGVDQHGQPWPFFFRSFADDLTGTYRYMVLLSQILWGPTLFATRLPAAFLSMCIVLLLYLSVKNWLGKWPAILAAFWSASSPWLLPYSRTGQRIILLPFALTLWFFFRMRSEKSPSKNRYITAPIILCLSLYTYVAARIVVPLLLLSSLIIDVKPFTRNHFRNSFVVIIIFLIVATPMIWHAIENPEQFTLRYQQVSIWQQNQSFMNNSIQFFRNYLSHFSPSFLFISGDSNIRHSQRGFGELFWSIIPFLLSGLFVSIRYRNQTAKLLLGWLLIAPIPAAMSIDGNPHALRSMSMVIPAILLSALGAKYLLQIYSKNTIIRIGFTTAIVLGVAEGVWVHYDLMVEYPKYSAADWEYGSREAVANGMMLSSSYDEIWITSRALGMDRIIALELLIPPKDFADYLEKCKKAPLDTPVGHTVFHWNYFIPISDVIARVSPARRLFIVRDMEVPFANEVLDPIIRPDGSIAFRFVTFPYP